MRLGFVESYKRIICLGDWSYRGLDAYSIANSYISQLRYLSEEHITGYRVPETIDDILERLEVSQEDKIYYVYNIYHSLRDNRAIRKDVLTVLNRQLYCNNRYSHCETYISLISQLFRALYFYSMLETETLSEEYRAELAPLVAY